MNSAKNKHWSVKCVSASALCKTQSAIITVIAPDQQAAARIACNRLKLDMNFIPGFVAESVTEVQPN